jgi:hypothetical protein
LARAGEGVLVLIPLIRPGFTTDAAIAQRIHTRLGAAADAIFARVRWMFDGAGIAVEVRIVRHSPGRALRAVRRRAFRARAREVLLPGSMVDGGSADQVYAINTHEPRWGHPGPQLVAVSSAARRDDLSLAPVGPDARE